MSGRTRRQFVPGDIVSIQAEDGKFAVIKILVADEAGVYGLIYGRLFTERPRIINISGLQVAHFAFTRDHFAQYQPEFLAHKEVTEEELKDYPFWATKISDCRNSVGEWLRLLAPDEKGQDGPISHQVH